MVLHNARTNTSLRCQSTKSNTVPTMENMSVSGMKTENSVVFESEQLTSDEMISACVDQERNIRTAA